MYNPGPLVRGFLLLKGCFIADCLRFARRTAWSPKVSESAPYIPLRGLLCFFLFPNTEASFVFTKRKNPIALSATGLFSF